MSNKKLFLIVLAITILLVPQISLAVWWNPFSWKIFNKVPTAKVQIKSTQPPLQIKDKTSNDQSSEIEALRKQVDELKKKPTTPITISPKPLILNGVGNKTNTKSTVSISLSNAQIIAKIKPAVVYIETEKSVGSGMIFTTDGYVLTNAHVVKGYSDVDISLATGATLSGKVVGRDEVADLAVVKISSAQKFSKVDFGNSSKTEQGDEVFALGFPFGIKGDVSFKEGTISRRIENYFETSAEIHPGNSGGPLVNRYGQVIGINTAIFGKSISGVQLGETIKLAIPINIAKQNISDLKAGKVTIDEVGAKQTEEKSRVEEERKRIQAEEQRKAEEAKKEAERRDAEAKAKEAEEQKRVEEENKRREAEISAAQQRLQRKQSVVAEYNTKKIGLEQQLANRKAKYYTDEIALNESFRGRGVTTSGVQWQFDALLTAANKDIDLLNLQLEKLYVEYSSKLNQF